MGNLTANVHPGIIRIPPPAYTGSYTVTPDEQGEVLETNGKVMTDDVTINPVPWVKPEGSKNITQNGTHNVEAYKTANVQVPQGVFPTGTKNITANGTYDVTNFASAEVNTDPAVGLIFEAPDWDALPTRLRVIGYLSIPDQFTGTYTGSYAGRLMANITELILPQTLTIIQRGGFVGMTSITSIYLPNVRSVGVAGFAKATALTKVEFGANSITSLYYAFSACASIKQMIFHGDISSGAWNNPFYGATPPVELYDFSHCTNVFPLSTTDHLPHASGCVIRVPASLLTEWQNATNWNALTDVVWGGV